IPLSVAPMSELQSKSYKEAYRRDKASFNKKLEDIDEVDDETDSPEDSSKSGLYTFSRRAALFVAPDGSYGDSLDGKWLIPSREETERKEAAKKSRQEKKSTTEQHTHTESRKKPK